MSRGWSGVLFGIVVVAIAALAFDPRRNVAGIVGGLGTALSGVVAKTVSPETPPGLPQPGGTMAGTLEQKVVGLPLWAWGVVGVGALYVHRKRTPVIVLVAEVPDVEPPSPDFYRSPYGRFSWAPESAVAAEARRERPEAAEAPSASSGVPSAGEAFTGAAFAPTAGGGIATPTTSRPKGAAPRVSSPWSALQSQPGYFKSRW